MVQLGFRKPTNRVTQGGSLGPEFFKVGASATAAKMLPGIAVCKDTNDYSVKEYDGSGNSIGYLGYDEAAAVFKPDDIDTAYAADDEVPVHRGPGRRQMARLASGQSVVNGQPLKLTTDGYLAAATINGVVSVDESGSSTVSTGNDEVVADADETVDASGAAKKIWVITRK